MNICLITLLGLVLSQTQPVKLKLMDRQNKPIEGVYVHINNEFVYSDSEGKVIIPVIENTNDTISFSHLSFKNVAIPVKDLISDPIVILETDVKELPEVVVSNLNEKDFVKEVIGLIPFNYTVAFEPHLYLNADILLKDENTALPIIKYKGGLMLIRKNGNDILVAKDNYDEYLKPEAKEYIYTVKPYNFTTIIPVTSHPVIREFKKFDFYQHEYVLYKGVEAIKVYFKLDRKNGRQDGFIIINTNDKAIMSINYSINPIDNWIGEKTKRGLVKTSLLKYFVEADYSKDLSGKYSFDSGRENIKLKIHIGKRYIQTSSDTYLKKVIINKKIENYMKIKEIF